jgi:putative ABC transport system ATP-binding protein
MKLLTGRNLRKTYRLSRRNSVEALRGVEVDIAPGEMVAIMGPSGSGKSTLMHILGLLHPADRNNGPPPELLIDGTDVARLSDRERTRLRARRMGFVFQSFNLVPTLTAVENVALAADYAGVARGAARRASLEALDWVGLAERADHRPMELSGGEQQRVAVARALVNEPILLLADEPTGNLDQRATRGIHELFRAINAAGTAVLIATHDDDVLRQGSMELAQHAAQGGAGIFVERLAPQEACQSLAAMGAAGERQIAEERFGFGVAQAR